MERRRLSQGALAQACGVSGTAISQIFRGNYRGDTEGILRRIQDFLSLEEEREEAFVSPSFVPTKQGEEVLTVCRLVHTHRFMGMVLSPPGLGKTMGLRQYLEKHRNAALMTASKWDSSRQAIVGLLFEALRISIGYNSIWQAVEIIIGRLGSGSVLLVDEVQQLTRETIEGLRYINDTGKVGIVFSGTLSFASRMSDKRVGLHYAQIASRIGCRRILSEVIEREDVKKILEQGLRNFTGDIFNFCYEKASGPGAFRTMMRYIQMARANAAAAREPVSLKHFQAAQEVLMI
jgi:hypothetical protein